MTLFGIVLAALFAAVAGLPRAAFSSLAAALPAWALALVGAYWSGNAVAGRFAAGLSALYLILLGVAWPAMSGKWS
jgi:hypothetical protein